MASLIPEAINLREAAKDVELLADQLGRCKCHLQCSLTPVPDFYFSQFLHHVVVEARRKRELPPASALPSRHPSPGLEVAPLPEPVESVKTCDSTESGTTSRLDFDFGIADNIFASEDWMSIVGGVGANDQPLLDPGNTFPFLPLGGCTVWALLTGRAVTIPSERCVRDGGPQRAATVVRPERRGCRARRRRAGPAGWVLAGFIQLECLMRCNVRVGPNAVPCCAGRSMWRDARTCWVNLGQPGAARVNRDNVSCLLHTVGQRA